MTLILLGTLAALTGHLIIAALAFALLFGKLLLFAVISNVPKTTEPSSAEYMVRLNEGCETKISIKGDN